MSAEATPQGSGARDNSRDGVLIMALDQLHENLKEQIILHYQLGEIVRRETEILSQADAPAMASLTSEKESHIHWIKNLEARRIDIVNTLSSRCMFRQSPPSLRQIIVHIGRDYPEHAQRLEKDLNELCAIVEKVKAINLGNQRLIAQTLEHVGLMQKNIFSESQVKTYNPQGQKNSVKLNQTGPRLISKEV